MFSPFQSQVSISPKPNDSSAQKSPPSTFSCSHGPLSKVFAIFNIKLHPALVTCSNALIVVKLDLFSRLSGAVVTCSLMDYLVKEAIKKITFGGEYKLCSHRKAKLWSHQSKRHWVFAECIQICNNR